MELKNVVIYSPEKSQSVMLFCIFAAKTEKTFMIRWIS